MNIIISPAKQMRVNTDDFQVDGLPHFINDAYIIRNKLKSMNEEELKKLWNCNDKIVKENLERLNDYELDKNLTPALIAYDGLQYKKMAPNVFSYQEWDYVLKHLFILSAVYGAVKPHDGVIPYRLEMQAELKIDNYKNLYDYWGDKIYNYITSNNDKIILNLASKEYSDVITPYVKDDVQIITCVFGIKVNGKLVQRSTEAKTCRGYMVRYLAINNVQDIEGVTKFNDYGYNYSRDLSDANTLVFVKEK